MTDEEEIEQLAKMWDAPVEIVREEYGLWRDYPVNDFYRFGLMRAAVMRRKGRKQHVATEGASQA
jgi:hypothetical protein